MAEPDAEQLRVHVTRIEAAVRRARRVESHSLVRDKDRLLAWAQQRTTLKAVGGVPVEMSRALPPVEALESLAGRCRPFLLANDAIHYPRVFKSLGYFVQTEPHLSELLRTMRSSWSTAERQNDDPLGAVVKRPDLEGGFDEGKSMKDLGYAWLYSDLAHSHEDERLAVEGHDLHARYWAGVALITYTALNVVSLLNFAREAVQRELLPIAASVMAEPTEPSETWSVQIVGAASGPVGTPMADLEAVLDRDQT